MSQHRLSDEFLVNWRVLRRLHWARVTFGGVCAELAVFAIVFPVLHFFGQTAFLTSILAASVLLPILLAIWVDRRVETHFVLHGPLVGVVATLVYVLVAWGHPEPLLYKVAHCLKLVGGTLGGALSASRASGQRVSNPI
jgi:peptidoglycan/LPS O-acetylase OafA/YrhL